MNSFVVCDCPKCNNSTPHKTHGVQADELGEFQRMECTLCGTTTRVATGKGGRGEAKRGHSELQSSETTTIIDRPSP